MAELNSLKDRSRSRKGRRHVLPLIICLLALCLIGGAGFYYYEKKYAPNKTQASLKDYFGVEGDQVAIYVNDEKAKENGTEVTAQCVNGGVFLPYEWVMSRFNRRFYFDDTEDAILYTLPTETVSYPVSATLPDGATAYLKLGNGTENLYLNIKLVELYTKLRFTSYVESDNKRIFIWDDYNAYTEGTIQKTEAVRVRGGIKSEVLTTLEAGSKVRILEAMENWSKVETEDGFIGYVRNKRIGDKKNVTPESSYTEPEWTHKLLPNGAKAVVGFHQVMKADANQYVDSVIDPAVTMNVIAPTWFVMSSSDGDVSSIADPAYVERAHARNCQVWATVNNFDITGVDSTVFLSSEEKRQALIERLITLAKDAGLDGLNIDFESIPESAGRSYVQFMRELSVATRKAGIILSADTYVPFDFNSHYDLEELGNCCDYVIMMCYDEHYAGGSEGSVSSISYVERGISEGTKVMDAGRLIIAVPFYTRVWITAKDGSTSSQALSLTDALDWAERKKVKLTWDDTLGQHYGEIQDGDELKKVWMEDSDSLKLKLEKIRLSDVGGVAAWKLGQAGTDIWQILDLNNAYSGNS
ncbi:MAG: glycosyl hydrolase family 18 protein [Oribacterium sp.]|nr:glycosyl hydrolase family 18 protein [Oribacterium sp.]MDY6309450.1 glycosyl hydrolase family 18 protein [Oribacterium sp.]MDY6316111.1 glycosyl hydrolase family 18 protein [Oribacterium sp.]